MNKKWFKKNKWYISLVLEIITLIIGNVSLIIKTGIYDNTFRISNLLYYHILITLMSTLYLFIKIVYKLFHSNHKHKCVFPHLKGVVILCEILIPFVYFFYYQSNFIIEDALFSTYISNTLIYYVIPFLILLDYLIFDEKGLFDRIDPFIWITVPYVYYMIIMLNGASGFINFGLNGNIKYFPYEILDVSKYGYIKITLNVFVLTLILMLFAYVISIIDRKLDK